MSMYTNGEYKKNHPSWHEEDAPWKAEEIFKLLKKNSINPKSILDFGCGTGTILNILSKRFKPIKAVGYEPFEKVLPKPNSNSRIQFVTKLPKNYFDLALIIDVVEHSDSPKEILAQVKDTAKYKIFHIPLALSIQARIRKNPIEFSRKNSGHLQTFTKKTALDLLKANNYQIIDSALTKGSILTPNKTSKQKFLNVFRKILFPIFPELTSKLLGGFSLLVITK